MVDRAPRSERASSFAAERTVHDLKSVHLWKMAPTIPFAKPEPTQQISVVAANEGKSSIPIIDGEGTAAATGCCSYDLGSLHANLLRSLHLTNLRMPQAQTQCFISVTQMSRAMRPRLSKPCVFRSRRIVRRPRLVGILALYPLRKSSNGGKHGNTTLEIARRRSVVCVSPLACSYSLCGT